MLKATCLAAGLALCLAVPARANDLKTDPLISAPSNPAFAADVVEVQQPHRTTGAIILTDAIGGAVVGAAVGGGVAVYNRYVSDSKSWGNWERDLSQVLTRAGV